MESLILVPSSRHVSITNSSAFSSDFKVQFTSRKRAMNFRASSPQILPCNVVLERLTPRSYIRYGPPYGDQDDDPEEQVESLRVPDAWSVPSKALEESEWLRVTLHKWLDEEYCPEETNVEISKVAAKSYYNSLLEKRTELADILLNMARELESISYKESFHGAFSSANAAVNLIAQRIELS
ncbi:uncharacterized protein LOC111460840 [Cucurbita moschata]|uniref:Uncharacterized protein LOC111460840 n=1 Tax=Cucurbita moschata TaxID=3662 RepID=A0A6J1H695_CUCMO|nr:uncharacterized protein LOC111460840 [Cucurbita moschata]XP_022959937.1 uncharacterized protein LOC111460840 [Cucurbita moschata]